jgi:hypothetical protein
MPDNQCECCGEIKSDVIYRLDIEAYTCDKCYAEWDLFDMSEDLFNYLGY